MLKEASDVTKECAEVSGTKRIVSHQETTRTRKKSKQKKERTKVKSNTSTTSDTRGHGKALVVA